ncbi:MAG: hypothetical protein ACK4X1_04425 [Terricaulis sp.]
MKAVSIFLAALLVAGSAAAQEPTPEAAIEMVSGHKVRLRGFDLERRADGRAYVHGWARREPGRAGLINAHLHVETFDANGASLALTEGGWNDPLSVRDRAASAVHVELAPDPSLQIVRVRVSVESGSRHD